MSNGLRRAAVGVHGSAELLHSSGQLKANFPDDTTDPC